MTEPKNIVQSFVDQLPGSQQAPVLERPSISDMERRLFEIEAARADPVGDLLRCWDEGRGDLEETERKADMVFRGLGRDEAAASRHWSVVERLAAGPGDVPAAHMFLHHAYRKGWVVEANPKTSLCHLERATDLGSDLANYCYACYWLEADKVLAKVLPPEPKAALSLLRHLGTNSKNQTVASLSRNTAAGYMVKTSSISEVSKDDRKMIDEYAANSQCVWPQDRLPLALFYAGEAKGSDYLGPQYQRSREQLLAGTESGVFEVRESCRAQLEAWGALPFVEPERTLSQKSGDVLKGAAVVGGIGGILWVWSTIGLILMGIGAMINAVMIPIILVLVVIAFVVSKSRASGK